MSVSTCVLLFSVISERMSFPVTTDKFLMKLSIPFFFFSFPYFFFFQINRAPSFGTDQKIDYDVKKGVLLNALKLLNIR